MVMLTCDVSKNIEFHPASSPGHRKLQSGIPNYFKKVQVALTS
jgi:hypothetical protein